MAGPQPAQEKPHEQTLTPPSIETVGRVVAAPSETVERMSTGVFLFALITSVKKREGQTVYSPPGLVTRNESNEFRH